MTYFTYFSLGVYDREGRETLPNEKEVISLLRSEVYEADKALNEEGGAGCSVKWYDFVDDMKGFSQQHPGMLFCLSLEGEENDDLSKHYFLDGKHQECPAELVYPPFDPAKLA